jgi:hypothetical protein
VSFITHEPLFVKQTWMVADRSLTMHVGSIFILTVSIGNEKC